jgi:hypothetical protein
VLPLVWVLAGALAAHLVLVIFENLLAPSATRHHELALTSIRRGAFAPIFWGGAIAGGGALPLVLLWIGASGTAGAAQAGLVAAAALFALAGNFAWEYIWVEAGQSVPLS